MMQKKRRSYSNLRTLLLLLCLAAIIALSMLYFRLKTASSTNSSVAFIASLDTMKVSRDTETRPLSSKEINAIIKLSASLHTNYITVDTHWDYAEYMKQWIDAIHTIGQHVWFRIHPNQWEHQNGTSGIMTPAQYQQSEQQFILAHPTFFHPGDILDPCPEPEQGHYWMSKYGSNWTSNAPNTATHDFNAFLRETTDTADSALHQLSITGVITTIRSTNSFFATHADVLEQATVKKFGRITVDSYPERDLLDADEATQARISELHTIYNLWHVPVIIGEMGYSNNQPVDDKTQQRVLKTEFSALQSLNYLAGVNYWVGPGSDTAGGYTYIVKKSDQKWSLRPAAQELAAFYNSVTTNRKQPYDAPSRLDREP